MKRKRRRRRRASVWPRIIFLACVLAVLLLYYFLPDLLLKEEMTVEAGTPAPAGEEFLRLDMGLPFRISGESEELLYRTGITEPGEYELGFTLLGRRGKALLRVEDTIAPKISVKDCEIFSGGSVSAEDFIEEVTDATRTSVRFLKEPDTVTPSVQEVKLEVEDQGGNTTVAQAILTVLADTTAPVIEGVRELTITEGDSISYKRGVTVTDNLDQEVALNIDTSMVNPNKPGDYPVVYSAVDSSGNEARISTVVHVKKLSLDTVTEELINVKADELLAKILDDSMDAYEKAETIYWWCHENIAYSDGTPKTDWIEGAYRGLVDQKGDCYVYAATSKCLLTRAGITNMDIEKIRVGDSMHYWNLVDIGEGWHHFDTTRRADGATFFYLTDKELMAYSDTHNGTHNYDRTKYPEIK